MQTADYVSDHEQILIDNSRREAKLKRTIAVLRDEFSHPTPTPTSDSTWTSQMRKFENFSTQARRVSDWNLTKGVLILSFGQVSVYSSSSPEFSESGQTRRKARRSRFAMTFVPSPMFWRTMIHLRLDWAARFSSLTVPMFSLRFMDIIPDDHPIIKASRRGDLCTLESIFSCRKVSPLCSTEAGWTPLHFAAAYGQIDACRLLIAQGASLDATGFRGVTPIHVAAHFGLFEAFKALLRAGSDPDDYHEHGMNAVFELLSNEMASNSPDLTNFLKWLSHGQEQFLLDTQARDNSERGILYHLAYPPSWTIRPSRALAIEQSEAIEFVLREGVKGDELDIYGISILHKACRDNRLDLVEILLSGDCNINATDRRGYTPLHYAVESKNFELVSTLIRYGSDIHAVTHDDDYNKHHLRNWRSTPLYLAAKLDWVEMVELLIQHGADYYDKNIVDAFHVAVAADSLQTVQYFIENKVDQLDFYLTINGAGRNTVMIENLFKAGALLDEEDDYGWTPLAWAANCGWHCTVRILVELGADLDKISRGLTPLGHAAADGDGDMVQILLVAGAQANLTGDERLTPWQLATGHGYSEIADNVARHAGASLNSKMFDALPRDFAGNEVDAPEAPRGVELDLTSAVKKGDLEVVERLMEAGCTLKTGKNYMWCPFSLAISWRHWKIAEKLVEAGAELNMCRENNADTPFMDAVISENVAFIELMIGHGADVNMSDDEGTTPLLRSLDLFWLSHGHPGKACYGNGEVVQILLSAGADVNVADKFGRTALGKAAAIGNLEAVIGLVKAGAELNRPSSQNSAWPLHPSSKLVYRLPLAWAALMGHDNVVKFLFDSGSEWRSLQKEPAVFYTHRLLMQSWFPDEAEATNAVPCVEPLRVSPRQAMGTSDAADAFLSKTTTNCFQENSKNQFFDPSKTEATSTLMSDRGYCTSLNHYTSRRLYATAVTMVRSLVQWTRTLYDSLQLIRIEAVALTCISLLLLARGSLQYFSTARWADVKLAALAILTGIFIASQIN